MSWDAIGVGSSLSLEGFRKSRKYYKASLAFNDFSHNEIGTNKIPGYQEAHNFPGAISRHIRISGQLQTRGRARLDHALERERVPCNGYRLRRGCQSRRDLAACVLYSSSRQHYKQLPIHRGLRQHMYSRRRLGIRTPAMIYYVGLYDDG